MSGPVMHYGVGKRKIEMNKTSSHSLQQAEKAGISASIEKHLRAYFAVLEDEMPAAGLYGRVLQEVEVPLFKIVLDECQGNQVKAAALLGLNRNTLRKKMKELGLSVGRETHTRKKGA